MRMRCAKCGTEWDDDPKNRDGRLCLACGYENPTPPKPSLAERIEAMGNQIVNASDIQGITHIHAANSAKQLRAIASELREIAEEMRQVYLEPCTACGARHLETYRTNTADRLARKEEP